jgi:hypothetical protein
VYVESYGGPQTAPHHVGEGLFGVMKTSSPTPSLSNFTFFDEGGVYVDYQGYERAVAEAQRERFRTDKAEMKRAAEKAERENHRAKVKAREEKRFRISWESKRRMSKSA